MKAWEFYTTITLGVICLLVTGVWIFLSQENLTRINKLQEDQFVLSKAQMTQQITVGVVRELNAVSSRNENVKNLLIKHGFYAPGAFSGEHR